MAQSSVLTWPVATMLVVFQGCITQSSLTLFLAMFYSFSYHIHWTHMGGITLQKLEVLYWVYHIGYTGLQTSNIKPQGCWKSNYRSVNGKLSKFGDLLWYRLIKVRFPIIAASTNPFPQTEGTASCHWQSRWIPVNFMAQKIVRRENLPHSNIPSGNLLHSYWKLP